MIMIRRFKLGILLLLVIFSFTNTGTAQINIREIKPAPGIKAWFVPEKTLPILSLTFSFSAGAAYEPADKRGMSALLAQMLLEGTEKRTSYQFKNDLLDQAIELSFTVDQDRITGNLRTSLQNLDKAVMLLKEVLYSPRFAEEDLNRLKSQHKVLLENQFEQPETQVELKHLQMLMGTHPYAFFPSRSLETLQNISATDMRSYYASHLTKDSLVIGVCGEISEEKLSTLLINLFGGLPDHSSLDVLPAPSLDFTARTETKVMNIPQSIVRFSHPGVRHTHPHFMKLYLLNHIIGGKSSSRLFYNIREKQGLVYNINTELHNLEHAQLFNGSFGTDNSSTAQVIKNIKTIWQDIAKKGITAQELKDAQAYLIGAFPRVFSSSKETASAIHTYQVYGLGLDYFKNRTQIINAVSLKDLNTFAQDFLKSDQLVFTVVGKDLNAR